MIDLNLLTEELDFSITLCTGGFEVKFLNNYSLIDFYNLIKPYKSIYYNTESRDRVYVFTGISFNTSNSNTNSIRFKCQVRWLTEKEFEPYLRRKKIKELWSDVDKS